MKLFFKQYHIQFNAFFSYKRTNMNIFFDTKQHSLKKKNLLVNYLVTQQLSSILIKESFFLRARVCVCVCSRHYGLPMARRALNFFLWVHLTRSMCAWAEIFDIFISFFFNSKARFFYFELNFLYFKFHLRARLSHSLRAKHFYME